MKPPKDGLAILAEQLKTKPYPKATHTPGPWKAGDSDFIRDINGHAVTRSTGSTDQEATANARLIAAAPELLEAVKAMQKYFDGSLPEGYPIGQKIEDAIAKAEGR